MNGQTSPGRTCAFVFALLAWATAIQAKTLSINAEGTGDYATIRAAINAADNGDIIVLEPGLYINFGNQDITMVDKILTLQSRNPNDPVVVADTVIDCQGDAPAWSTHWAIGAESSGAPTHLTLAGLTIRNGWDVGNGCAVRCDNADLDVTNCTFQNNRTFDSLGGAVYCHNSRARFTGCTFSNNSSDVLHGGAIYSVASQLDFTNCSFEASTGCALETYDCQLTLTNCAFRNNKGKDGGAIRCQGDTTPETTSLTLTRCIFAGNSSSTQGGALYLHNTKTITISACTFSTNTADQDGGAIYNYRTSPTVLSCLFAGNTAVGSGGAIQNLAGSSPNLLNCTLVANAAGKGGAVASLAGSNPRVSSSILWGNTATQGNSVYVGSWVWGTPPNGTATVAFCDVEGGRNSAFTEPGCGLTWDSASNLDQDPLFVAPTTADYHLSPGSPCINAGDPAYTPGSGQTDLDGHARRVGSAVDLGAYEFQTACTLIVNNGSGDGQYPVGHVQAISADPAPSGKKFDRWTGDTQYVANVNEASTTVTMSAANVTLTATYINANPTVLLHDWNGDGIISIIGDVPGFVQCVYFDNWPSDVDPIAVGDCNGDGIISIVGDVPGFVDCVYFQKNCPK